MWRKMALALVLVALAAAPAAALTTRDVERMLEERIGEQVILDQIEADGSVFHLTADELVALKQAGASDALLEALIRTARTEGARGKGGEWDRGYDAPGIAVHLYYDPFGYDPFRPGWGSTPWFYAYRFPFRWIDCGAYYAGWWPWRWTWAGPSYCWSYPGGRWYPSHAGYSGDHRSRPEGRHAWTRSTARPEPRSRPDYRPLGRASRSTPDPNRPSVRSARESRPGGDRARPEIRSTPRPGRASSPSGRPASPPRGAGGHGSPPGGTPRSGGRR